MEWSLIFNISFRSLNLWSFRCCFDYRDNNLRSLLYNFWSLLNFRSFHSFWCLKNFRSNFWWLDSFWCSHNFWGLNSFRCLYSFSWNYRFSCNHSFRCSDYFRNNNRLRWLHMSFYFLLNNWSCSYRCFYWSSYRSFYWSYRSFYWSLSYRSFYWNLSCRNFYRSWCYRCFYRSFHSSNLWNWFSSDRSSDWNIRFRMFCLVCFHFGNRFANWNDFLSFSLLRSNRWWRFSWLLVLFLIWHFNIIMIKKFFLLNKF